MDTKDTEPFGDKFEFIETTISDIQSALSAGTLTCVALVEAYLDRIEKIVGAGG